MKGPPAISQTPARIQPPRVKGLAQPLNGQQLRTSKVGLWAIGCIFISFVLFFTALRDGHDWGGDFAQYILHAQALLNGQAYSPPPGYIHNPYLPWATQTYPPLFPLCIAGILALSGLNFIAMKALVVVFFLIVLYTYWRLLLASMPAKIALGALAFLAFSPYMLKFSNKLLTDIPYIAFSLFVILAAERFFKEKSTPRDAIGLGLLLVLSGCLRFMSLSLILAVPAYALLFRRSHLLRALLISAICFFTLKAISGGMIGSYVDVVGLSPSRLLFWIQGKPQGYFFNLSRYLALYPSHTSTLNLLFNVPAAAVYLGLCILGATHLFRSRGIKYQDIYLAVYLATICVYSISKLRYLIPIIPLMSIYAFQGLRIGTVFIRKHLRLPVRLPSLCKRIYRYRFFYPALLYLPLFTIYWFHYTLQPTTPGANILNNPDVRDLFTHVQNSRNHISGAIFDRPRVLTLFTEIRATCAFNSKVQLSRAVTWDLPMLLDLVSKQQISHVIVSPANDATTQAMQPIIKKNPEYFQLEYNNPGYKIYRIHILNVDQTSPPTAGKTLLTHPGGKISVARSGRS